VPFARDLQCLDHAPAHQTEVACIDGDRNIGQTANDAIKRAGRQQLERAFALARTAHRVDDVIAFAPTFQERGDQLGGILQIAVHEDNRVTARGIDARRRGDLMPEVTREIHHDDFVMRQCQVAKLQQRCVARAVVHQDELVARRAGQLVHNAADAADQLIDVALFIKERNDDRDQLR
jgi:hypothetical protein